MKKTFLFLAAAGFTISANAQQPEAVKIKPVQKISLSIPEPSDICAKPGTDSFYIVSDNGLLFETDADGNVRQESDYRGLDSEGVWADNNYVYVAEEFTRNVKVFDRNTLKLIRTVNVPYGGGRNKGYEAITYNEAKGKFVLLTEKSPIYLYELDKDFRVVNEIDLSGIANDISSASYHNGHFWLLSDEDSTVFELNPNDYSIIARWKLPVLNPEGMAFDKDGNLIIVSDDMQKLYHFNNPESNN